MSDASRHIRKSKGDPGCRRVRRLLPDLLDQDLSGASREAVEAHLAVCPACSAERDALRDTLLALQDRPRPEADPRLLEDMRRQVRLRLAEDMAPRRLPWRLWVPVAAAASLALLLWWASPRRSPEPGDAMIPQLEMAGWQSLSSLGSNIGELEILLDDPRASVDELLGELSEAQLERLSARLEDLMG
jgi:hypothetical protein